MRGPVLLALQSADAAACVAVGRAHSLSVVVGDALHVLRVIEGHAPDELRRFEAERELRRVCRSELPEALGSDRLRVESGDFVSRTLETLRRVGAGLLVLATGPRAAADSAELAARSGLPVLVARSPRSAGGIVAATDLHQAGYPVVQLVARLRARLDAPVALLHNVAPPEPLLGAAGELHREEKLALQERHLRDVADELVPGARLYTLQRDSAATAIVEAGADDDCDLIVVGVPTRPRGAFDSAVAEDVVRRATRSVLVAPLA